MNFNLKTVRAATFAVAALAAMPAYAATMFTGTGVPASDGAFSGSTSVATFSGADQTFGSYTEGGVSLSAGRVDNQYASNYNSTGSYYDNNAGGTGTITISFASPTDVFAFNWGAADHSWTANLFAGATNLGSFTVAPTFASNAKDYVGFTGTGITSAVFTDSSSGDWVFIDNLTYGAGQASGVPETATWAMMILGMGMIGGAMRRRNVKTSVRFA